MTFKKALVAVSLTIALAASVFLVSAAIIKASSTPVAPSVPVAGDFAPAGPGPAAAGTRQAAAVAVSPPAAKKPAAVPAAADFVQIAVPYVSEAPDNIWTGSWKNACEEASIAMLQYYYAGKDTETVAESKTFMRMLFAKERQLWGSDANSDVERTLQLISDYSSFSAKIAETPTVADIKAELAAGRPVIVPINGFLLGNENIPFLATGSGYHMFVLIGYDDRNGEFIAHDTGDNVAGVAHRYAYGRIMDSLHDYDAKRQKTDGPARALFTFPKLAKTAASHRVYFLSEGVKRYVSHPHIFSQRGWDWSWVNVVSPAFLAGFEEGEAIRPK